MEKFCKSCGMPMDKPEDFANNNPNSNYCYYCGDLESNHEDEDDYEKPIMEKEEYYRKKEVKMKKKSVKIKPRKVRSVIKIPLKVQSKKTTKKKRK